MKPFFKALGLVAVICGTVALLYFWNLAASYKKYSEQVKKVSHIVMFFEQETEPMAVVEFRICDSLYTYSYTQVKDTISENVVISDKKFPCHVKIKYHYANGRVKTLPVDSFNCAGCSGANTYKLAEDKVNYVYTP